MLIRSVRDGKGNMRTGETRAVVVAGVLVLVACLAAGLAGPAAAWDGNATADDRGLSDPSEPVDERVEETVERTRDTADSAVDGTVDAVDGDRNGPASDADRPATDTDATPVDPEPVTDAVRTDGGLGDGAPLGLDVAGVGAVHLGIGVTWGDGDSDGLVVALDPVEGGPPPAATAPAGPDGLDPGGARAPGPSGSTGAPVAPTSGVTRSAAGPAAADPATRRAQRAAAAMADGRAGADTAAVRGGSIIDSLDPFVGVPLPAIAIPAWAVVVLLFVKPLASALSGLLAVFGEWGGRVVAAFRFGKEDEGPLEHELRARMHDLVGRSPGVTLTELADRTDASLSTVRHHARVLERERLVSSDKIRGNRRFFPRGAEHEELIAALDGEMSGRIIEELRDRGAATVGDLVDAADRSYSTVSYHLERLAEDGIVVKTRDGAHTVSRLAPWAEAALDRRANQQAPDRGREVGAD